MPLRTPFQPQLRSKVPDFDGNPSFTVASKDLYNITTDANGAAAGVIQFGYGITRNFNAASIVAGVATLYGGAFSSWDDYTGMISSTAASASRVVTGGFKLNNLLSLAGTTAASGRMVIAPIGNFAAVTLESSGGGTFTEATLRKQPGCIVIPLAGLAASHHPVVGSTAPLDPSALCYTKAAQALTTVGNDGPNMLNFIYLITGAPASVAAVEVEQVCHWEVLPTLAYGSLASDPIESSATIMDRAVNWFSQQDPIRWAETLSSYFGDRGYQSLTNY